MGTIAAGSAYPVHNRTQTEDCVTKPRFYPQKGVSTMKREDVKNKIPGITEEQLNWLMQENGADINREKSAATALTKTTVYEKIVDARTQLSNTYVPTGGRPQGRTA